MSKSFIAVRLLGFASLFFVAASLGAQQPSQPAAPDTQPPPPALPQPGNAPLTGPSQPGTQTQVQTGNAAAPGLYGPWFVEGFYWMPSTRPLLRGGNGAIGDEGLNYPKTSKDAPGIFLSLPVSKTAMLNFSGFITKGNTTTIAPDALTLFGTSYSEGDLLTASYTVKDFKLSLNDLLYPFPRREGQKWRLKTLWEVQYASIATNLNAPYAPTTDSSGNAIVNTATGSRWVVYPTFGLAVELHPTRRLEFQVNGSGFMVPHHSAIGDAEAFLGYRIGHVELLVAEKYFHFKTSEQNTEYFKTTLEGAYAALRLYPSGISIPCPFCGRRRSTTAANAPEAGGATSTTSAPSSTSGAPSTTTSESASSAGPGPVTTNPREGTSTSSTTPQQGTFIHRLSAGLTASVLGLGLIPSRTSIVNTSTSLMTTYSTAGASELLGYGLTGQVAVTDHFAVAFEGLLRRIGYVLSTTVTTSKETLVAGVETTTTTSTGTHEDTRASLIDVPILARYFTKERHERGNRMFLEAGGSWRNTEDIRTSISSTNAMSQLSCCTFTPAVPAHRTAIGGTVGGGVLFIDAFGIHVYLEATYTRWRNAIFETLTTDTRRNEVTGGLTIGF